MLQNTLLSLAIGYALWRGGKPERYAAIAIVIGIAATNVVLAGPRQRYHGLEVGVALIDTLYFVAMVVLALKSDRQWPMWLAPVAGVEVFGHLVAWLIPGVFPTVYGNLVQLMIYPQLLILLLGTWRCRLYGTGGWAHERARVFPRGESGTSR